MTWTDPPYPAKAGVLSDLLSGMKYFFLAIVLILSGVSVASGADMTVAVMKGNSLLPYDEVLAGFKAGIKQRNGAVDFVTIGEDEYPSLDARIALVRPNLILCLDLKALERASQIKNIPKIFCLVTAANIESWSRRNDIYGVFLDVSPATQFRIMRQAFPERRRIGVIYDPRHNRKIIEEAKRAAAAAGFSLQAFPVDTIKEIPFAFEQLEQNADLLWTLYDPTVYGPESARYVLMQSLQKKIPAVGFSPHFAKAGAILALYGDYHDMGQQAALQALGLLNGEGNVARFWGPRSVRIAVNNKVGRFLGVNFSPLFLKMVHQSY